MGKLLTDITNKMKAIMGKPTQAAITGGQAPPAIMGGQTPPAMTGGQAPPAIMDSYPGTRGNAYANIVPTINHKYNSNIFNLYAESFKG